MCKGTETGSQAANRNKELWELMVTGIINISVEHVTEE
jgi:hypothetical protein